MPAVKGKPFLKPEILRTKNNVTRRAKGRLRHDLVWAGNRFWRAVERQRRGDQVIPNRRLTETDGRGENDSDDECYLHAGSLLQPSARELLLAAANRTIPSQP